MIEIISTLIYCKMTSVSKKTMLKALQDTEFPKNTGRTNILKGKQTYSQSMVLGKVKEHHECIISMYSGEQGRDIGDAVHHGDGPPTHALTCATKIKQSCIHDQSESS